MMESLSSLSSHAARRLVWVALVTSLALTIGGSRPRADNTFIPPLAAQGHQPRRGTFGLLPWERIDMASGNGVLSFTDLVLPGDAGFDLRFQRVLNLNDLSWHIGVPGPSQLVLTHGLTHQNPTIISMDGAEEYTFQSATGSDQYRTLAYGRLTKTTRTLELPNGLVYHFDHQVTADIWDVTEVADPYGNTLSFSYADGVTTIVQSVSGSSRVVVYDGNTKTMSWNGRTWVYQYDSNGLTAVVPPAGPPWQFSYGTYPAGTSPITYGRRITVTTANGGKVQYDVESQAGPGSPDPTYWHWVVRTRSSWDRGGATLGTWTFDYAADGSISSVSGPDGISHHYAHTQTDGPGEGGVYASRVFLTGHQVRQNGATLETTTLTWRWADTDEVGLPLDISPDGTPSSTFTEAAQPVLPSEVSVTRAGSSSSWTTTYIYSETDGELNDYGQPRQIDETGDFSRSTARTFWSSDAPYIGGAVETETIGNAFETVYDRNGQGFVTSRTVYGVPTAYTSDAHGNVASETDANGHTTTYDCSWGVVSGVHAPEHTTQRQINPDGTVQTETRGAYQRVFVYDDLGRETNRGLRDLANGSAFIGNDTATSYAPDGSSVHSSRGASWTTTFLDGFGRPVGTENAVGVKTRLAYTEWGDQSYEGYPYSDTADPVTVTTSDRGTTIAYDGLGRVEKRTNPDGTFIGYDYSGLETTITDEKGRASKQTWKATGHPSRARLVEVVDADQQHTTYGYDILDALKSVTHPDGTSRSWLYNPKHQLDSETHPESGSVTYAYDPAGNVYTRTDANGMVLTYSYDGDDRLIRVETPGTAYDTTIGYDDWGNRRFVGNAYVTRDFAFKADRLTQVADQVRASEGGAWASYVTHYGYDENDNVSEITYPAGPHRTVRYTYDAGNRITCVYEDGGPTYADAFTYHPSGAVAGYTSGNGVVNALDYSDSHQRYWPHQISAGSVFSLTYGYDDVGNVLSIDGAVSGNQAFQYDVLDRLTNATGPWGTKAYHYDPVGNRDWKDGPSRTTYTLVGNRLMSATGAEAESFTSDPSGRLTGDGLGTYTYTPFDMLEQAATATGLTATYRYDGDERRTASLISGVARYFLHGPGHVLLAEVKNEGGPESWVRDYIYAGTRLLASARDAHVTLTVDKFQRNGRGTVTSEPAGIACGATCTTARAVFGLGVSMTLTAAPEPGSAFAGWSAECGGTSSSTTFSLGGDTTCRARFIVPTTVTVHHAGTGAGTITVTDGDTGQTAVACAAGSCEGVVDQGATVTLHASAASGSAFKMWSGDCSGTTEPLTITATQATTCTATFVPVYWLTITKAGDGAGLSTVTTTPTGIPMAILCGGMCSVQYMEGTLVALSAQPPAGVTFVGWSGHEDCQDGSVTMDGARSCQATFSVLYPKLQPANGATGVASSVSLTWAPPMNGVANTVCWYTGSTNPCYGANAQALWAPTGQQATKPLTNLTPGTTYVWQVRVTLADGSTPEADQGTWWTFTTAGVAPSPPVTKQSPADAATGLGTSVTLIWASTLSDAGYVLCWGSSATGADCPLAGGWAPNGASLTKQLNGLAAGTYYWQVRADAAGGSYYADAGVWHGFTVGTSATPPGSFSKTAPAAGAAGLSQPVTLSWGASAGATSYAYCLDEVLNDACDGPWHPVVTGTSALASGLTGGATVEWQVKALNSAGEAVATDAWRTFTVAAAPLPLTKTSPADAATGLGTSVTLSWTSTLSNVAYWVCWGPTATGTTCPLTGGWAPNGASPSKTVASLAPGTYYWQVRAQTAAGFVEGDAGTWWAFTVAGTPAPGAFTLTAPAAGATGQGTSVGLSWGASSGAASYAYCVDTTLNGACTGTWQSAGTATTATVTGLTASATYEWQVRAQNGTGTTEATGGWRTFTVAAPAPLTKTSPANAATGQGTPVVLTWTTTLTDPGYTVCWDQTNNNVCDTMWWPNGGSPVKWAETLAPGTYYWQVRAQTTAGTVEADGGAWWTFTVGSVPEEEAGDELAAGEDAGGLPSGPAGGGPVPPLVVAAGLGLTGWGRRRSTRRVLTAGLGLLALLWPAGVAAQTGTAVEYYHLDAVGTVRAVTNASGQVVRRHDVTPFGEEVSPTVPNPDRQLFTGQERDPETSLDYFGARYYRANLGRFTTVDPVYTWTENLVDPQRWNRYSYVRNNPLKFVDPDGRYTSGCAMVELSCADAMAKFEGERQKALKNRNADVAAAAEEYGSLGDPGVVVTPDFAGLLAGANGSTTRPDAPGGDIGVLFDPGAALLQRTIVHEGVHVGQAQGFMNSFDPVSGKYDKAQNPVVVLAELSAFQTGARVAPYWVGGTLGSIGPNDTVKILQYLTGTTPYRQTLNQRFFGIATWPQ